MAAIKLADKSIVVLHTLDIKSLKKVLNNEGDLYGIVFDSNHDSAFSRYHKSLESHWEEICKKKEEDNNEPYRVEKWTLERTGNGIRLMIENPHWSFNKNCISSTNKWSIFSQSDNFDLVGISQNGYGKKFQNLEINNINDIKFFINKLYEHVQNNCGRIYNVDNTIKSSGNLNTFIHSKKCKCNG